MAGIGGKNQELRGARVFHDSIQLTTDPSAFGCDLFTCLLMKRHHKSDKFERSEQTVVALVVDNDVVIGRQKLLTDTRERLLVQFLASSLQQVKLKKIIGQHNKDDLIDDHGEGTRSEMGQVVEALELTIPLFGRGTQMVLLLGLAWILNLLRIN